MGELIFEFILGGVRKSAASKPWRGSGWLASSAKKSALAKSERSACGAAGGGRKGERRFCRCA